MCKCADGVTTGCKLIFDSLCIRPMAESYTRDTHSVNVCRLSVSTPFALPQIAYPDQQCEALQGKYVLKFVNAVLFFELWFLLWSPLPVAPIKCCFHLGVTALAWSDIHRGAPVRGGGLCCCFLSTSSSELMDLGLWRIHIIRGGQAHRSPPTAQCLVSIVKIPGVPLSDVATGHGPPLSVIICGACEPCKLHPKPSTTNL